jgi:hypothetical protein
MEMKTEFKNTEKFFVWIDEVLAPNLRALYSSATEAGQAHLEDVARQYRMTEITTFEMPKLFTQSGKREYINFDVEEIDNYETGIFTTIISF